MSDVKLRTPENAIYYPDLMVLCDESDNDPYVKQRPSLVVEVLSESTRDTDRSEKWLSYPTLESLQAYVLLAQDTPRSEVFRRPAEGWLYGKKDGELLKLPCVNLEVTLSAIYSRLE